MRAIAVGFVGRSGHSLPLLFLLLLISALPIRGLLGPPRENTCEHLARLEHENATQTTNETSTADEFEYAGSSATCAAALGADWEALRSCGEHELSLGLFTDSILPHNRLPYIRLNMSATMHEPASAVWFVYRCLQASNQEDNYCVSPPVPAPCRGMRLVNSANTTAPFRADIACFRIFGFSHYRLDVVVKPQECVATAFFSMPHENKYDPTILRYLNGGGHVVQKNVEGVTNLPPVDYEQWSPFVFVETQPTDGVWVRFEEPPRESHVLEVRFALFRQSNTSDSASYVGEEVVRLPQTGFKWTELDAGRYLIFGYVQLSHCRLSCDRDRANDEAASERKCVACPHTALNFTLHEAKHTAGWKRRAALANAAFVTLVVLLVVLSIIGVALFGVLVYQRYVRPALIRRRPPQTFELTAQPRVLLVYTDDCAAHSDCCLQLAFFLARNASARVHIDQLDLVDPSVQATNWLLNRMMNVDFVILVFSDGSKRVMEGERMGEQRPFPDLFNAATRLVVSTITNILNATPALPPEAANGRAPRNGNSWRSALFASNSNGHFAGGRNAAAPEALRKFLVLRFKYSSSDAVAEFFPLVGCACYEVPGDLPRVVGHLHGIDVHESSVLDFTDEHLQLDQAIRAFVRFRQANPNYLAERFASGAPTIGGLNTSTGVPLADPQLPERGGRTAEEMAELTRRYELVHPPTDDEDDEPNGRLPAYSNADTGVVVESSSDGREANRRNPPPRTAEEFPLVEVSSSDEDD
ncbi:hypothetical protein M3Y99_00567000 [Aphelenchoides fujianensis]|nr:hypothetical protein M3Y99_00567000 [Aphelenchoides fujianensis]